jgi:hypothetical protein
MKRLFVIVIFAAALIACTDHATARASGISKPIGGKITQGSKATPVQNIEGSNYKCTIPGTNFTLKPVGGGTATDFYISPGARVGTSIRSNQWFLGNFSTKSSFTCIYQGYPPNTTSVQLDTINLYGASK